jgi:cytochrome c oxidase subunit 2
MPSRHDQRRTSRWPRRLALLASLAAVAFAAGGCSVSLYPPTPVTNQGRSIYDLYNVVFIIAALIFVAVELALVYIVFRFRRRGSDETLPIQTHGHTGVETLWTIIPFAIVAFLFVISWQALGRVQADTSQAADVRIKVVGSQWCWEFDYLDEGVKLLPPSNSKGVNCRDEQGNAPTMVVPVGKLIRLQLHSNDVIHAFYVPQFLSKLDVVPQANEARDNVFDFTAFQVGEYRGQCAEFCGLRHNEMQLAVSVRSEADYQAWLTAEKNKPSPTPQASPPPGATALQLAAVPVQKYDTANLQAPSAPFTIQFDNKDPGQMHNVAIQDQGGTLVFNGQPLVTGPGQATYVVDKPLPPGTYKFFCIVHPTTMFGTLDVR